MEDSRMDAAFSLNNPLVVVMVGLPARGKTYTARKLARYLSWLGYRAQVFNVGNYRRSQVGSRVPHSFFDPDNSDGVAARRRAALDALGDLFRWFDEELGQIAIYDATNSTESRRESVLQRCKERGFDVLFLEIACHDAAIIEANIRETKLTSPDYAGVSTDNAVQDFRARIAHYEAAYETITDDSLRYIKIIDVGRQVVINRSDGYLVGRIANFLTNLSVTPRPIWLTRHGESLANVGHRIGGDEGLSPRGALYANNLARFLNERVGEGVTILNSTLQRAQQTAAALGRPSVTVKVLDEIDAGICDGFTYTEIRARYPDEYAARQKDKLRYRYPRGESYEDVITRLEPVIIELERQREPTLVVAHQAVLRALYAYFANHPRQDVPYLDIPLHTVIELIPKAYGCDERRYHLGSSPG
ncbi:MAG: broad specificity phosphatase PhoE/predicted kinase [Myxococcota bacterium]|jgi:broad specificity phosphatase PhoE/predicted kinase